jgi:hypothetical protein
LQSRDPEGTHNRVRSGVAHIISWSNEGVSHRAKRLQARKLSAELAAMAPTNESDYVRRAAAAYDTQEEDNKNLENNRGQQQGVTRS